jgi:ABC-2 type transport system permease protein
MTSWAEEKRQGTDELLFTLPATDFEILLGKYLSMLAVFTVALVFSGFNLVMLELYADPDWGLLCTTYFGYWLAGGALLAAGMFASVLTSSVTVSFVLGVAFCAIPIFIGKLSTAHPAFAALSLTEQMREYNLGLIPLTSLTYFVSLIAFFLYLNAIFIGKRHWSGGPDGGAMTGQFWVRGVCLLVTLISVNVLVVRVSEAFPFPVSADLTSEHLFTLSPTTRELIKKIDGTRPVTIQAFRIWKFDLWTSRHSAKKPKRPDCSASCRFKPSPKKMAVVVRKRFTWASSSAARLTRSWSRCLRPGRRSNTN